MAYEDKGIWMRYQLAAPAKCDHCHANRAYTVVGMDAEPTSPNIYICQPCLEEWQAVRMTGVHL